LAKQFSIHPTQVNLWKKQLLEGAESVYDNGMAARKKEESTEREAQLYQQVGRLSMELEWLKKKVAELDS
jgi:putative transposase